MNCRDVSLLVVGTALTLAGTAAAPAEHSIPSSIPSATPSDTRVPDIDPVRPAAGVISRADRAIRRYLDACRSNRDAADVVTPDARIEYTLDDPGAFLSLDASSILSTCASVGASGARPSQLWIFPTGEENAVFVQYDVSASASGEVPAARQVALVEMRGERIHRLRNFGAAPERLLAAIHGTVQSELCARLSWNGERLATNAMTMRIVHPPRDAYSVRVSSP
jgi:hypothetical protein